MSEPDTITLPYGVFRVHPGDSLNAETEANGFWDRDLKPFLDRAQFGWQVIDVGAHVGFYSVYWALRGCHVISIEGHPLYWPLLMENLIANRCLSVAMNHFVYSRACRLREVLEHDTHASNTWLPIEALGPDDVEARTLDEVCGQLGRIDFLKVDTQGTDLHVLLGAEQIVCRDHPLILVEYEEALTARHGHTAMDYARWIAEHQYLKHTINGWNAFLEPL